MATRRDPNRLRFTKTALAALPVPAKGRAYHYDERTAGLTICITSTDTRTFYVYRKVNGKPVRIRLGKFPDLTLENARAATAEIMGDVAKGRDPHAERKAKRREWTFTDLFEHWMTYAKAHKKTWPEDQRKFDKLLTDWHNRRLSKIKKTNVARLHTAIAERNGRYEANRTLALVRAMFNKAIDDDVWDGGNPTQGIKRFREEERERYLDADEIPRFFEALKTESQQWQDFFTIALLTGVRRGNLQAMRWDDVNLAARTWRVPATKSGEAVTIALVDEVIEILKRRKRQVEGSEWVFPARNGGPISDPRKAWQRVCDVAGFTDVRMHDLRRTLGSWQAATGESLPIIGKSLGHKDGSDATKVYARLNMDPVRRSVDTASAAIMAAANGKPKQKRRAKKGGGTDGKD